MWKLEVLRKHIYKVLSSLVFKYDRYRKVTITRKEFDEIKGTDLFITSIQLSRIANSILSIYRSYLRVKNDIRLPNVKDRHELILLLAATIFESIDAFLRQSKILHNTEDWKNNLQIIKEIQNEMNDKKSFRNTILFFVRNKVLFHFEREVFDKILSKYATDKELLLAVGRTERNRDSVFIMADNLILASIISEIDMDISDMEKYNWFEMKVLDLSRKLIGLCTKLSATLIRPHAKLEKGRIYLK